MTFRGWPALGAATIVAILASGCSQKQVEETTHSIATQAPAVLGDAATVAQIEGKFVAIDADSSLHVAVAAHDGRVTLNGKVKAPAVASRFVAAAKETSGVKSVTANLGVDRTLPSSTQAAKDITLAAAVTAGLVGQAGINAFSVKVTAKNGVATLAGTAKTQAIKTTLLDSAKHTAGVREVVDRIEVQS